MFDNNSFIQGTGIAHTPGEAIAELNTPGMYIANYYGTVTGDDTAAYPLTVRAVLYQDGRALTNSADEVTLSEAGVSVVIGGDALVLVNQGTSQIYLRNENANITWTDAQLSIGTAHLTIHRKP